MATTQYDKKKKGSFMNFYKPSTAAAGDPSTAAPNRPSSFPTTPPPTTARPHGWLPKKKKPTTRNNNFPPEIKRVDDESIVEARRSFSHVEGKVAERTVEGRRSVSSQVEMNVAAAVSLLKVKVLVADMAGFMQVHAFRCARKSYDSLDKNKFSSKQMALHLKKEFDEVYGPAWHCIVGSSFGSFVTHGTGCFLYFSMEKLYVLLFKTKVQRASS